MVTYDKGKYHTDEVEELGLPYTNRSTHIIFYLRWLVESHLVNDSFNASIQMTREQFLAEYAKSHAQFSLFLDEILSADILSDEGNQFTNSYYHANSGANYQNDYRNILVGDLESIYMIDYSKENYERLKQILDQQFANWKKNITNDGKIAIATTKKLNINLKGYTNKRLLSVGAIDLLEKAKNKQYEFTDVGSWVSISRDLGPIVETLDLWPRERFDGVDFEPRINLTVKTVEDIYQDFNEANIIHTGSATVEASVNELIGDSQLLRLQPLPKDSSDDMVYQFVDQLLNSTEIALRKLEFVRDMDSFAKYVLNSGRWLQGKTVKRAITRLTVMALSNMSRIEVARYGEKYLMSLHAEDLEIYESFKLFLRERGMI